jgi:hypothetical protein
MCGVGRECERECKGCVQHGRGEKGEDLLIIK